MYEKALAPTVWLENFADWHFFFVLRELILRLGQIGFSCWLWGMLRAIEIHIFKQ